MAQLFIKTQDDNLEDEKEITTYDEWIKYNNEISKVIITNKTNQEGFLRLRGDVWRKLYCPNLFNKENLLGFIKYYQYPYVCDGPDLYYNVEEILEDTLKKCLKKKINKYKLNYCEYVFLISNDDKYDGYVIFNSENFTFTPVDELISDKILTLDDEGGGSFNVNNTINISISIVDAILNSLITNEIKDTYKKLVYNLIVKQGEQQIVFFDYNDCLLTIWIKDLLFNISKNKFYANSAEYYENKQKFKQNKHKYRCVIIHEIKDISIEHQIRDFLKLEFKNIIVCQDESYYKFGRTSTMYNMEKFIKNLHDNKEIIIKCLKEQNKNNYVNIQRIEERLTRDYDLIFYDSHLLKTNFLKWCCIK